MPAEESPSSWSRRDLLLVPVLIAAAGVQSLALALGRVTWNSDQGIVALMGRHIALGIANPIFCYGSYYGGTLEPHLTAVVFSVLGMTRWTYRLSLMLFLAALLLVVYAIGRRYLGRPQALIAAGYLALPPFFFLLKGLTSDGAYDSLAILGGAITFAALRLDEEVEKNGHPRLWFLLLGVFAGLAWWVHPLSAYFFLAVAVWFLVVNPRVLRRLRDYPAFLVGFLLGSLPWWIENLRNGWLSLKTHEAATLPLREAILQFFRFFTVGVPALFGGRSFYSAAQNFPGASLVAWTIFGIVAAATVVRIVRGGVRWKRSTDSSPETSETPTLLLLLLLLVSMQVVTSFSDRTYRADPRFLFPAYVPFSLLFGYWTVRLGRKFGWKIAASAGLAVAAFHAVGLARTEGQEHWSTTGSLAPLVRALEERGLHDVYTGYWTAYRLAFESEERIRPGIFGIEAADRYPEYTRAVDRSASPAVVLRDSEASQFRDYLRRVGSRAKIAPVGPHVIFWDFEPAVLEELRRLHNFPPAS
jgi:Dolichyl-phosphate-mannose-protein mannosyltransferase